MGGVLIKKWKMGVFCKQVDLSSTQGALCTVSVFFYLTFYLFGGAYAAKAPCLQACALCAPGQCTVLDNAPAIRHPYDRQMAR